MRCRDARQASAGVMDLRIDTRQVTPESLRDEMLRAMAATIRKPRTDSARRLQVVPQQHRVGVQQALLELPGRLGEGDRAKATSRRCRAASPTATTKKPSRTAWPISGPCCATWRQSNQLPAEIFILEIGVGSGTRCGMFVEKFRALDQQRGTNYYPRLRVLMGDYSLETLDMSRPAVKEHIDLCSFLALDALNPLKTLSFLRHKILYIHSTNMYDNLPDEEILRRDGRLFYVHVRAYVPMSDAVTTRGEVQGPGGQHSRRRWTSCLPSARISWATAAAAWLSGRSSGRPSAWKKKSWPSRTCRILRCPTASTCRGWKISCEESPGDLRFHLSSGALESFVNTIPLLHPRGYLQVQDIFVTDLNEYRVGFHGPGKLDGSIVNWVNGALLKGVAERTGYDLHFAPYRYRKESKTSVLYTTPRE